VTLCLTVRQPYAAAIVCGLKPIESRSWYTPHRGRLLIHAGLTVDEDTPAELIERCSPITLGAVIGEAELYDVEAGRAPGAGYSATRSS
jgi:hypothetical protein